MYLCVLYLSENKQRLLQITMYMEIIISIVLFYDVSEGS